VTNAELANSLFMVKSSSRLLVELLSRGVTQAALTQQNFYQLAHNLILMAEAAYIHQDLNAIKEVSELLVNLPIPKAQSAGLWYQVYLQKRKGQLSEATQNLEELIANRKALPRYRARAIQTLGLIQHESGNLDLARQLYIESAQRIRYEFPQDAITISDSIILYSHVRADQGDIKQSLNELLSIENLIQKLRNPRLTPTYCNNVAVGLLENGRIQEAARYSRVACQSPLAFAYPEWQETAIEIEQHVASKNIVTVTVAPGPRKRPAQPKYLLIVLRFSPLVRVICPVAFRLRVTCNNPTVALVVLVARIRAPSL
jgi:hypothetical protein